MINRKDLNLSIAHFEIEGSHRTAFSLTAIRGVTCLSSLYNLESQK